MPLLTALDDVGVGTVLTAPFGSDQADGVVGVLRASDADGVVSSVDRLDTVNGVTVTVLALAEQIAGGVGHYGTGEGCGRSGARPAAQGLSHGRPGSQCSGAVAGRAERVLRAVGTGASAAAAG